MEPVTPTLPDDDVAAIDRLGAIYKELSSELSKMIIGQQRVVELLSIALFSRGPVPVFMDLERLFQHQHLH